MSMNHRDRHLRAVPSTTAEDSPVEASPEDHWLQHVDALNFIYDQLEALSHAMFAVVFTQEEFHKAANAPIDDLCTLSEMGEELCEQARAHTDALHRCLQAKAP